jgi:3-dehydroquinate synthase
MENNIKVNLEDNSYDIFVENGAISKLSEFLGQKYSQIFVICDENVENLHYETLKNAINERKIVKITVKSGEKSKSFDNFERICEEILSHAPDRKSLIIAFGGGVVGDLSGFVASVILRGVDFVQIPTTILSAVDSSVGGKTAINCKIGKNLIGSFYQPKLVICDLNFLKTLPKREILAGYSEILKYGLIHDCDFFKFLDQNHEKLFALDQEVLKKVILHSCAIKAEIVGLDEKEKGIRALLNYGHTFGHSLEQELNYDGRLNHGEAVGIGMLMASKMSKNLGFLSDDDYQKISAHINKTGLNIDLKKIEKKWNKQNLVKNLYHDKKTENGQLNFILLKNIGSAFVQKNICEKDFLDAISDYL